MRATHEERDWSDLQPELLELVLQRLDLRDYLKCGRVCRSWRNMVKDANKRRCPHLLLLPVPDAHCLIGNNPATLLDITGNNLQQLMIPTHAWEGYGFLVQSQEGWLMFQGFIPPCNNIAHRLFWLFNPVSGEKYELPRLPYRPVPFPCMRVAFSSAPDSQTFLAVVMASLNEDDSIPQLSFCRIHDKSWTHIETNRTYFKDIVLFERELYAMNANFVTIFNLKDLNAITTQRLVVHLPKLDGPYPEYRLARDPTCGEMLLLLFTCYPYDIKTKDVHIFKLDMSGSRWIGVESLKDHVVFVDHSGVRFISTANLNGPPEFTGGNCVVFSLHSYHPFKVFSLKEKTIQQSHVSFPKNSGQFLWFTPGP